MLKKFNCGYTNDGSWSIIVELLHCSPNGATMNLKESVVQIYFIQLPTSLVSEILLHPGFLLTPTNLVYFFQTQSLLSPLGFPNGLHESCPLTIWAPWLDY
jgi:hypothetical protein